MKFELKMHPEKCLLQNENCCPFREFYYLEAPECEYFHIILKGNKYREYWERCPECLAEEKRQESEVRGE